MARQLRQRAAKTKVCYKEKRAMKKVKVKVESPTVEGAPVFYADDGAVFYPCSHCCRAFSNKVELDRHTELCVAEEQQKVAIDAAKTNIRKSRAKTELNNNGKRRASSPDTERSVISTDSVMQNINNLNDEMKSIVLRNINELLKDSSVKVVTPADGNPIIMTEANGSLPALQITSRNIDQQCVEIKTSFLNGKRNPTDKVPDLSEILEAHFGKSRTHSPGKTKTSPRTPKSIQAIVDDDSDIEEITIEDSDLEGTIVLEDIDIHICKQCGSVYHTLDDLVNHDKYEHRNVKKRYQTSELQKYDAAFRASKKNECPICGKFLRSKAAWPRHLDSHSTVQRFECRICSRKFTRKDHCNIHEKRHVVT